jgi:cytochrome c-type biogenesis protein CcmF
MIALLGDLGVLAGLFGAIGLVLQGSQALRLRTTPDMKRMVQLLFGGAVVSMLALQIALLTDDFSLSYTANHHASTTPFLFKISTAWSALEGSIVLWALMLGIFGYLMWRNYRKAPDSLGAVALGVTGLVAVFFFGMILTIANPFEVCTAAAQTGCLESSLNPFASIQAPLEGRGPNPLLQNHILVAIHPPILYVGYVGLTVPFAYAIAALALNQPGAEWARRSHRWTLITWSFLAVGILLGGLWSYVVLGWGGYWAWDPVENASLLPWIVATALIHSLAVQLRRGIMQSWNFALAISAFGLTIFGTFLTRSGAVISVHSFTESPVGPAFLGFFLFIVVGSMALYAVRADAAASENKIGSLVSREGGILTNNVLLTVWTVTVLLGTVYPIFVGVFSDRTISIGRAFYDKTSLPIVLVLLLVLGLSETAPWKAATKATLADRLYIPMVAGLATAALTAVLGLRSRGTMLAAGLAVFIVAGPALRLYRLASAAASRRDMGLLQAARNIVRRDRGYWGGMLSHVGVAIIAVGIAASSGLSVTTVDLSIDKDETVLFDSYELTYVSGYTASSPQRDETGANVLVERNGRTIGTYQPQINAYPTIAIPTPAVVEGFSRDLYLSLKNIDGDHILLDAHVFPLQWMVWLGGFVIAAGGLYSAKGRRARDSKEAPERTSA